MDTLVYVTRAPFFWQSMGFTTATSLFVGALVFNGDIKLVIKGIVAILTYAFFVIFTTAARINPYIVRSHLETLHMNPMFASLYTLIFTSVFYCIGMILGVLIVSRIRKTRHTYAS